MLESLALIDGIRFAVRSERQAIHFLGITSLNPNQGFSILPRTSSDQLKAGDHGAPKLLSAPPLANQSDSPFGSLLSQRKPIKPPSDENRFPLPPPKTQQRLTHSPPSKTPLPRAPGQRYRRSETPLPPKKEHPSRPLSRENSESFRRDLSSEKTRKEPSPPSSKSQERKVADKQTRDLPEDQKTKIQMDDEQKASIPPPDREMTEDVSSEIKNDDSSIQAINSTPLSKSLSKTDLTKNNEVTNFPLHHSAADNMLRSELESQHIILKPERKLSTDRKSHQQSFLGSYRLENSLQPTGNPFPSPTQHDLSNVSERGVNPTIPNVNPINHNDISLDTNTNHIPQKEATYSYFIPKKHHTHAPEKIDAITKNLEKIRSSLPKNDAASLTPILSFMTGKVDQLTPEAIPSLVMNNTFIQDALASNDLDHFLNTPVPTSHLISSLDLDQSVAIHNKVGMIAEKIQFLSPNQLFKMLDLDYQVISSELKMLKSQLSIDGFSPYIRRSQALNKSIDRQDPIQEPKRFVNDTILSTNRFEKENDLKKNGIMPPNIPIMSEAKSLKNQIFVNHPGANQNSAKGTLHQVSFQPTDKNIIQDFRSSMTSPTQIDFNHPTQPPHPPTLRDPSSFPWTTVSETTDLFQEKVSPLIVEHHLDSISDSKQLNLPGSRLPGMDSEALPFPRTLSTELEDNSPISLTHPIKTRPLLSVVRERESLSEPFYQNETLSDATNIQYDIEVKAAGAHPHQSLYHPLSTDDGDHVPSTSRSAFFEYSDQSYDSEGFSHQPTFASDTLLSRPPNKDPHNDLTSMEQSVVETPISIPSEGNERPIKDEFTQERSGPSTRPEPGSLLPRDVTLTGSQSPFKLDGSTIAQKSSDNSAQTEGNSQRRDFENKFPELTNHIKRAEMKVHDNGGALRVDMGQGKEAIDLAMEVQNDKLELKIAAGNQQIRNSLASEINQLKESLQHQNLSLENVEVGLRQGNSNSENSSQSKEFHNHGQNETPTDRRENKPSYRYQVKKNSPNITTHSGQIQILV